MAVPQARNKDTPLPFSSHKGDQSSAARCEKAKNLARLFLGKICSFLSHCFDSLFFFSKSGQEMAFQWPKSAIKDRPKWQHWLRVALPGQQQCWWEYGTTRYGGATTPKTDPPTQHTYRISYFVFNICHKNLCVTCSACDKWFQKLCNSPERLKNTKKYTERRKKRKKKRNEYSRTR